jgi:phage terminase large subunit
MSSVNLHHKYKPMLKNKGKYFIVTGGRGSGKSFGVTVCVLLLTYEEGHKILYTRYTMSSAEKSIIPEFLEKIELMGLQDVFEVTKKTITNKLTGSSIMFSGIQTASGDQTANLKSINGLTTFVLDEGEELLDEEKFDKINLSIRKKGVQNRCIVIMNPTTKEHFIYSKFFEARGVPEGSNTQSGNATYIHTTYIDNLDNLDEDFIAEAEDMKARNPEKYKHQILGGWLDRAEGVIFTDWSIGDFNDDLDSIFGQDFGFSNDPSTLVEVAVDKKNRTIYLKEHLCKVSLSGKVLGDYNRRIAGNKLIVCDNSDPRLRTELNAMGLNMTPTLKFKDSIMTGIQLMQDYHMVVDKSSVNLIKELNNYVFKPTGTNGGKSVPIDKWNHNLDAARYAVQYLLGRTIARGKYVFS